MRETVLWGTTRREWLAVLLLLLLLGLGAGLVVALLHATEPPEGGPLYAFHGWDRDLSEEEAASGGESTDLGGTLIGTDGEVVVPSAEFMYGFGARFPVSSFKGLPYAQDAPVGENRFAQMEVWTHYDADSDDVSNATEPDDGSTASRRRRSLLSDVMADGIDARSSGSMCVQVSCVRKHAERFVSPPPPPARQRLPPQQPPLLGLCARGLERVALCCLGSGSTLLGSLVSSPQSLKRAPLVCIRRIPNRVARKRAG